MKFILKVLFMKIIRSEMAWMGEGHPSPVTGKVANCLTKGLFYFDNSHFTTSKLSFCYSDSLNNYILTIFPPQVHRPPTSSEPPLLPGLCSIISSKRQLKTVPKKAKLTCHGAALLSRNPSLTPCRLQPLPLPPHKPMTCGWRGENNRLRQK